MTRFFLFTLVVLACHGTLLADKLLVLDTRVIESAENARLMPGTVTKHESNPLFQADKPWENSMNNLYPNVIWDDAEKVFKMWYKCVLADNDAIRKMDGISTVHDVGWYLLYATSKDGIAWEKPALGLHAFGGTKDTNIVARDCPNVGVFKDLHDADPARRYKMVSDVGLGKPQVRFSADGIHWGAAIAAQGFGTHHGDTHNNAFWDEGSGKYLWFTKLYLGERLVARFESDDFLHWRNNGLVLRSSMLEGRTSQTYCMPVFRHAGIYLSYVMMYHLGKGRTVDCELAWSPDGLQWQRVTPGVPLIPRGSPGSYDSECIYAMAGPLITREGKHLIFYGGDDFPHTGWKRHCLPCLATLREDGFAGYEPVETGKSAVLTTKPLRVTAEPFRVIADGDVPEITAMDERGQTVEKAAWAGKTLRFRVLIPHGKIYALEGLALVDRNLPPKINPLKDAAWEPSAVQSHVSDFASNEQTWKGVDKATARDGHLTVSREGRNPPFAYSSIVTEQFMNSDWTKTVGGRGARITCRVRGGKPGGRVIIEVFAGDVGAWKFETQTTFSTDWQEATAVLRYDWTDDEARAAGWTRAHDNGFPWHETITNVGKVVITPSAAGAQTTFDLDDVRVSGVE
jgi:hypothetical protein